jgi:DNA-binding PadR family transcriptional regulator
MEEKQWLQSSWKKADTGRERKYYAITERGNQELEEQLSQWNFINNLITKLWKPEISI